MLTGQTKILKDEQYQDFVARLINAKFNFEDKDMFNENILQGHCVKTVTFQVTENCNLCCSYCYQTNKSKERMSFETAKEFIDLLIKESYNEKSSFHISKAAGIIIEFIGGEPLLEIKLIDQIYDYFKYRLIQENHPWAIYHRVSMISNGVKYFEPEVQKFLQKNPNTINFSITLDGNKALHDSCRLFPDGTGSYDMAVKACKYHMEHHDNIMYTKMTLAPENIIYAYDAILNLIDLGYIYIHSNCVYENVWDKEIHPKILYEQMKKIVDYLFDNSLENKIMISLFKEDHFATCTDDQNYCGSNCSMLALDNKGEIYPCVRFMKSSLGNDIVPYSIGSIDKGIGTEGAYKDRFEELYSITRTSQSKDKCINCPIATGCGWCTAYNYQVTGSVNKRLMSICEMHQARALGNVYYWNKLYIHNNVNKVFPMNIPKEWALEIIDEEEYNMLLELTNR